MKRTLQQKIKYAQKLAEKLSCRFVNIEEKIYLDHVVEVDQSIAVFTGQVFKNGEPIRRSTWILHWSDINYGLVKI